MRAIFCYPLVLCGFLMLDMLILFVSAIIEYKVEYQEALFHKDQLLPHITGLCIGLGCAWFERRFASRSSS